MGERDVARDSRLDGERQPDDLCLHRVEDSWSRYRSTRARHARSHPAIAPGSPRPAPSRSVAGRRREHRPPRVPRAHPDRRRAASARARRDRRWQARRRTGIAIGGPRHRMAIDRGACDAARESRPVPSRSHCLNSKRS
jgi:hypothetical protein